MTTTVIPQHIQEHLESVITTFGLENDSETMDRLKAGWLEKEEAFKSEMANMGMEEIDSFQTYDERGVLALTYSGSLISIGPLVEGERKVDYTSIGVRRDVPESVTKEGSQLAEDMALDKGVVFDGGPIQQTSPVYKIVACPEDLSSEEQTDMIQQATTMIIDTFADINQETLMLE